MTCCSLYLLFLVSAILLMQRTSLRLAWYGGEGVGQLGKATRRLPLFSVLQLPCSCSQNSLFRSVKFLVLRVACVGSKCS